MASQKEQFHEKGQIYQANELLFDIPNPQDSFVVWVVKQVLHTVNYHY